MATINAYANEAPNLKGDILNSAAIIRLVFAKIKVWCSVVLWTFRFPQYLLTQLAMPCCSCICQVDSARHQDKPSHAESEIREAVSILDEAIYQLRDYSRTPDLISTLRTRSHALQLYFDITGAVYTNTVMCQYMVRARNGGYTVQYSMAYIHRTYRS